MDASRPRYTRAGGQKFITERRENKLLTKNGYAVAAVFVAMAAVGNQGAAAAAPKHQHPSGSNHRISVACNEAALVAAINSANNDGGGTIDLAARCNYVITTNHGGAEDGLPAITSPVVINGRDATIIRSSAAETQFRLIRVANTPNSFLSLNNTTIRNGSANAGGGILNDGRLETQNSTFYQNRATGDGGALHNTGIASIRNTVFQQNLSGFFGGGIENAVSGTLTVRGGAISGNQAVGGGGGVTNFGTADFTGTSISQNRAETGGGIFQSSANAKLTMRSGAVTRNIATGTAGGGIDNRDVTSTVQLISTEVSYNHANGRGVGGGINTDGPLTLDRSRIVYNTATGAGGGIRTTNTANITSTRITDNTAGNGGGIANENGNVNLTRSIVTANTPNNCIPAGSVPNCVG
ncbi:hypothetical protein [Streptomyces sp. NRRL F-2664]|uniref:hypothetical protein n=1 Tax=Streptomyces sp. NRRL F-2664 TaxID=1463842 RepID=UPI00131BAA74|nr:hypothetical protein [Streptomyces sp. NRRL F-2664]